jgi:isopentenyl-diphosphate delta-isomerase
MPTDEVFEIFDEHSRLVGTAPRAKVHREGLYHRSVHVMLLDPHGRLLIQQRAQAKDVCPGRWDLSCGEHLKPQETYAQAAARGLAEELSLDGAGLHLRLIRGIHRQQHEYPELGVKDFELVECWQGSCEGPVPAIYIDEHELSRVAWVEVASVARSMARDPQLYTPWFQDELAWLRATGAPPWRGAR